MDPIKLDRAAAQGLVDNYGYEDIAAELARRDGWPNLEEDELTGGVPVLDDFAVCDITRKEDWVELYAKPFYFGCEADDRMNVVRVRRAPIRSAPGSTRSSARTSGISTCRTCCSPLPEAYELVEDELITAGRFPRLHLRQRGAAVGHAEPALLRRHGVAKEAAAVLKPAAPARAAAE